MCLINVSLINISLTIVSLMKVSLPPIQADILRRLQHPSVVSLVAVAVRPRRLVVMEFAPCKSLADVLKSSSGLSRTLQLKLCQQVRTQIQYLI